MLATSLDVARAAGDIDMKFRKASIRVRNFVDGESIDREVDALVCGPLAIHKRQLREGSATGRDYVITHVATGFTADNRTHGFNLAALRREVELMLASYVWSDSQFTFGVLPPEEWLSRAWQVQQSARNAILT